MLVRVILLVVWEKSSKFCRKIRQKVGSLKLGNLTLTAIQYRSIFTIEKRNHVAGPHLHRAKGRKKTHWGRYGDFRDWPGTTFLGWNMSYLVLQMMLIQFRNVQELFPEASDFCSNRPENRHLRCLES